MALVSPGVEVTVIDESTYIPSAVNSVPYFFIATAQNKVSSDGITVAAGTLAANANKTYLITSQRDLSATFGVPFFYNTTTGTPINGYELNEYGLLAAYSSLGVTNRAYVQRVDIDLSELTASLARPTGAPASGSYWLNTSTSTWGIQEWNQTTNTFTVKTPTVITDPASVVDGTGTSIADLTPLASVGTIGDYAVVAVTPTLLGFYKNADNAWVLIGSDDWKNSWPTVTGTASPGSLASYTGNNIYLNNNLVAVGDSGQALTVSGFAQSINLAAIAGVTAAAVNGKLVIYTDSDATNDGSTGDGGIVSIAAGPNSGAALLTALGIASSEYRAPTYYVGYSYQSPRWRTTDVAPHPSGSVWNNISTANNGMNLAVSKYSSSLGDWVSQKTTVQLDDPVAIYALDPANGGSAIPVGTTYAQYNTNALTPDATTGNYNTTFSFEIFDRVATGPTIVTGTTVPTGTAFGVGDTFQLFGTEPGSSTVNDNTVTIGGTGTVADFIAAVSAADVPYVSASVNSSGNIVFTHSKGGTIVLQDLLTGTAVADAGFIVGTTTYARPSNQIIGGVQLSYFVTDPLFTYTPALTSPDVDPADGRLWYYSTPSEVDIMIQNNGSWRGYQQVTNDVRGYNLSSTNASGPIIAATAPLTQNNTAKSPLVYGDLWIDSSDLENYPLLYRWESVDGVDQWVSVDTADQVTENGILFADARWAPNGTTDPVMDPIPTIQSLLTSPYVDLDAPDPALYPQGMLLFNTRRSGYNVKSFQSDYFNSTNFPNDSLPTVTSTWLSASGLKDDGSMYAGRLAQRAMIVKAFRAGIDTSLTAREEQTQFNLIATPAYPEVLVNMTGLNDERGDTAFVVGDTPMRLPGDGTSIANWRTNNSGLGLPAGDGLTTSSQYAAVFYPSGQTNDLSGNTVVVPPSHMMVRTILRNDAIAYPWFAPAGTRRGVIDNASAIGYINGTTGEFVQLSVSRGLRDVLYERQINPITYLPGVGITNYGNKSLTTITSALDRINVARLVAYLRNRLDAIGQQFLFEPNDTITRNQMTNTVNSLMIDLVAKRAIYDYLVVCDLSNNTPSRIDRNELWVDIAIEPVKAVEFIYIPLRIKNTGAISGAAA